MPSIIDQIAADLKISNASVSRALNDRPGVSQALRTRVLQRARDLHYTSSITARGLATSQTFALGFFVREKPDVFAEMDPFYGPILRGVEQVLAVSDYHVAVGVLTTDILSTPNAFRFVRERRVDGMLLAGPDIPTDFILAMMAADAPLVLVDNKLAHAAINCVRADDEGGGYAAAHHLIDYGHQQIGAISGPPTWYSNAQRMNGLQAALAQAELAPFIEYAGRTTIESGEAATQKLLLAHPRITAIAAVNDAMALGAIRAARQMGRRVPEDLSVIGFDNIAWATLNDPPLTTIHVPKRQLGQEAAKRLLSLLGGSAAPPVEVAVSTQLIVRQSTQTLV